MFIKTNDGWKVFEITAADFHLDRRTRTLIVDNPGIIQAVTCDRWAVGKVHLQPPDPLHDVSDVGYFYFRVWGHSPDYFEMVSCFYSNEELEMMVRLTYPRESKNPEFFKLTIYAARYGEFAELIKTPPPKSVLDELESKGITFPHPSRASLIHRAIFNCV